MRGRATLVLAFAFLTGAGPSGGRKPVVTVQPPARVVLAPGGWAEARLIVAVADGFHLQANPSSEEYLVPTKLELVASGGVEPGDPMYPPGRPYRLQGASKDLSTYEGSFEIHLPLRASPGAESGEHAVSGKLHYQACDARSCLFPASVAVEVRVQVTPPRSRSAKSH